jgi:hypothetical protein
MVDGVHDPGFKQRCHGPRIGPAGLRQTPVWSARWRPAPTRGSLGKPRAQGPHCAADEAIRSGVTAGRGAGAPSHRLLRAAAGCCGASRAGLPVLAGPAAPSAGIRRASRAKPWPTSPRRWRRRPSRRPPCAPTRPTGPIFLTGAKRTVSFPSRRRRPPSAPISPAWRLATCPPAFAGGCRQWFNDLPWNPAPRHPGRAADARPAGAEGGRADPHNAAADSSHL